MRRRFQIETTMYGKRLITREQLYQLHREVARAAAEARRDDPQYQANYEMGMRAAAETTEAFRKEARRTFDPKGYPIEPRA